MRSETSDILPSPFLLLASYLGYGLWPWVAVGIGLYGFRSAFVAFLLYHALCFIGGLILRAETPPAVERRFATDVAALVACGLAANVLVALVYTVSGTYLIDRATALEFLKGAGLPPPSYIYLFPYFAIVNPIAEEFYWRGGVYLRLRGRFQNTSNETGPSWFRAAFLTSLLFAAWHWLVLRLIFPPVLALMATVVVAIAGLLFTFVYERTHRLLYAILLHALAADVPLLTVLYLMNRG